MRFLPLVILALIASDSWAEGASSPPHIPYILLSLFLSVLLIVQTFRYSRLKHTLAAVTSEECGSVNSRQTIQDEAEQCHYQEEQILQQSRLAQMGEMISMIAHQWRQPLGAIASTAIGIETKIRLNKLDFSSPEGGAKTEQYLLERTELIAKYVNTLTTTIDDFRNFYQKDKIKEYIKIGTLVRKALGIIQGAMEQKGISVDVRIDDESDILLYPNEIIQVFLNILQNAYDQLNEENVSDPSIAIAVFASGNSTHIEISDNAGGIADEILPKIFLPYFSTKVEKNGTGIGLYMSKIIVENHHNGFLSASNRGEGACFAIRFPHTQRGEHS